MVPPELTERRHHMLRTLFRTGDLQRGETAGERPMLADSKTYLGKPHPGKCKDMSSWGIPPRPTRSPQYRDEDETVLADGRVGKSHEGSHKEFEALLRHSSLQEIWQVQGTHPSGDATSASLLLAADKIQHRRKEQNINLVLQNETEACLKGLGVGR